MGLVVLWLVSVVVVVVLVKDPWKDFLFFRPLPRRGEALDEDLVAVGDGMAGSGKAVQPSSAPIELIAKGSSGGLLLLLLLLVLLLHTDPLNDFCEADIILESDFCLAMVAPAPVGTSVILAELEVLDFAPGGLVLSRNESCCCGWGDILPDFCFVSGCIVMSFRLPLLPVPLDDVRGE